MKAKLAALLALLITGAFIEYLLAPRPTLLPDSASLISRLLPSAVGSFRRTRQWSDNPFTTVAEVVAAYRNAGGVSAQLDFWLGAGGAHNGISCWLSRGDPLLWQRLSEIRTANGSALFDTALIRDRHGLALLAATQCYPTGCRERLIATGIDFELPFFSFSHPAWGAAPVPVSILIRESGDPPGERPAAKGERLVSDFRGFAAALDLSPLLNSIPAQRTTTQAESE